MYARFCVLIMLMGLCRFRLHKSHSNKVLCLPYNIQTTNLPHSHCSSKIFQQPQLKSVQLNLRLNKPFQMISADMATSSRSQSQTNQDLSQDAREIFNSAVNSVLPSQMIKNALHFDKDRQTLSVSGRQYQVNHNVHVVGFGKAVLGMARAVDDCLRDHIVRGVISVPCGIVSALTQAGKQDMLLTPHSKICVREGARDNLPDLVAQRSAEEIGQLAGGLREGDLMLVLISGGGSALLPSPIHPVTLEEMLQVTRTMARAGATIVELNSVRKQLEELKGGGLARLARPAEVVSLILSDVIGDPLDFIASGPTVADSTTADTCLQLFNQLNIQGNIPHSVTELLTAKYQELNTHSESSLNPLSAITELCSDSESCPQEDWSNVHNVLVGTNKIACERARSISEELGYKSIIISTELEGEVQSVSEIFSCLAKYIVMFIKPKTLDIDFETKVEELENILVSYKCLDSKTLLEIKNIAGEISTIRTQNNNHIQPKGLCVIAGGETTVNIIGSGKGGRNQEMAVWTAVDFQRFLSSDTPNYLKEGQLLRSKSIVKSPIKTPLDSSNVAFLSAGTDGQDGPTPVAGAVVTVDFCRQAQEQGLSICEYLKNNDSYHLLKQKDGGEDHVVTGLTGTNVMDVQVLLVQS